MNKINHAALQNLVGSAQAASVKLAAESLGPEVVKSPLGGLSARELQVLIAIGSGIQPIQAAKRLGIAVKSFGTYRARVLEKLQLESNAELAVLAFELKLVPSVLERFKAEAK